MKKNLIKREEKELKNIFHILVKRDFKGYTGMAVKNMGYQFSTTFVVKLGSLFFTIILARLLMPELFGLYSLALGTIIMIASFFELGIGPAIIKFVSQALGKKDKSKAKSYFVYLLKIKAFLLFLSVITLLAIAKFLAYNYYNKPIFLALLAGAFYILCTGFLGTFSNLFQAFNDFKAPLLKEIFAQSIRLIFVPLVVLYAINNFSSQENILFLLIFSLSLVYLASLLFLLILSIKKFNLVKEKRKSLLKKEKKEINKFVFIVSATALSGIFFGYIDIIILGRFVLAEFLGFYSAAFSLIGSLAPLIAFSSVLFPIFSRLKGKRLERGLTRSTNLIILFSIILFIITILFAPIIIKIIYGSNYVSSILLLRILSLLLLVLPITAIYDSYFLSIGKPAIIAKFLIIATVLNIVLNYFLITWLLNYSQLYAAMGAAVATVLSRYFYFGVLLIQKKKLLRKSKNIKTN